MMTQPVAERQKEHEHINAIINKRYRYDDKDNSDAYELAWLTAVSCCWVSLQRPFIVMHDQADIACMSMKNCTIMA